MLNYRHLYYFWVVTKEGGFAIFLFVTLPVASHMLARAAAKQQFDRHEIARAPLYPHP
jgi:multisubunit Na+/H+ antiporter MnhG subunit